MKFANQVAIVTGAGSGIGREAAVMFAEKGAKVVVADIDMKAAEETCQMISNLNQVALPTKVDVSNSNDVKNMVNTAIQQYNRLDILFNNAGVILPKPLEDVQENEWDRLCNINLKGVYLGCKYALPFLRKTKGNIINMASMTGVVGQKSNAAYSATKGGVIAMTKALAIDCAMEGIRVNAICPAGVDTPLLQDWLSRQSDPERSKRDQDMSHLLGWTASTKEIANVVLFLASKEASFITGEIVKVDGGATLGYGVGPKPEWLGIVKETGGQEI